MEFLVMGVLELQWDDGWHQTIGQLCEMHQLWSQNVCTH